VLLQIKNKYGACFINCNMAKYSTNRKNNAPPTEGETIQYNGNDVGVITYYRNQPVFVWKQSPLNIESSQNKTAYSMSIGLIDLLESMGVNEVDLRGELISLSQIKRGKDILCTDSRFDSPPDERQKVIFI